MDRLTSAEEYKLSKPKREREGERERESKQRLHHGDKVSLHWTYCLACNPSTLQMKWVMQLNAYSYILKEQNNNNRRHTQIQADPGTQCRLEHEQSGSERQKY